MNEFVPWFVHQSCMSLVTVVTPLGLFSLGYTDKIEFLDGKAKYQTANPT